MDVKAKQRARLQATIDWARQLRASLQPILDARGDRVHFRPGSSGIAMVGILHDRPQLGESGIRNLEELVRDFEARFAKHCLNIEHGKVSGEKELQSFLIRESYTHGRRLEPVNLSTIGTNEPVDLTFVTDEIALPLVAEGKIVCDVLALRRDGGRCTPVLLELKDSRQMKRLVTQVEAYSTLIDDHADSFAELFSALLGETVRFDGRRTEKWIVWPSAWPGSDPRNDPREAELAAKGIRVVAYEQNRKGVYSLRAGGVALA